MGKSLFVAALALFFGSQPPAHPDFSGRWVLESSSSSASDVPRALWVRQSLVSTNVRGEPMTPFFKDITIEREVDGLRRAETYAIGVVGGTVHGRNADGSGGGSREDHAVRWDRNALVFESSAQTGERREAWSLGADGRLHVVITMRSAVEATTTRTMVYRRTAFQAFGEGLIISEEWKAR